MVVRPLFLLDYWYLQENPGTVHLIPTTALLRYRSSLWQGKNLQPDKLTQLEVGETSIEPTQVETDETSTLPPTLVETLKSTGSNSDRLRRSTRAKSSLTWLTIFYRKGEYCDKPESRVRYETRHLWAEWKSVLAILRVISEDKLEFQRNGMSVFPSSECSNRASVYPQSVPIYLGILSVFFSYFCLIPHYLQT
ncbi:hypothetical protein J6590_009427 [Homalodisca vitripennis]|nr:hypothetical protein J6590_009427 [Homalodisca vitripennis]